MTFTLTLNGTHGFEGDDALYFEQNLQDHVSDLVHSLKDQDSVELTSAMYHSDRLGSIDYLAPPPSEEEPAERDDLGAPEDEEVHDGPSD